MLYIYIYIHIIYIYIYIYITNKSLRIRHIDVFKTATIRYIIMTWPYGTYIHASVINDMSRHIASTIFTIDAYLSLHTYIYTYIYIYIYVWHILHSTKSGLLVS